MQNVQAIKMNKAAVADEWVQLKLENTFLYVRQSSDIINLSAA